MIVRSIKVRGSLKLTVRTDFASFFFVAFGNYLILKVYNCISANIVTFLSRISDPVKMQISLSPSLDLQNLQFFVLEKNSFAYSCLMVVINHRNTLEKNQRKKMPQPFKGPFK